MKRYLFAFLVLAAGAGAARSAVADDAEGGPLPGEWLLISIEVQGQTLPAPEGKGGSMVFAQDGKLILKDPGKPDKLGKYTLDADKNPKHIDLIESKDGKAMQGIYAVEGDKLKMAFSAEGSKGKRPSDFKDEKVLIVHLKRRKS